MHKIFGADSAPQLSQRRQKQTDILETASAAKDLFWPWNR